MLLAHGPAAVIANRALQSKQLNKLSIGKRLVVDILAFIFGILPDFDFFILIALSKPYFIHHQIITHTPIFWIAAFLLAYIAFNLLRKVFNGKVEKIISENFAQILLKTFLYSTLTHLATDLFTGYLMLLYPFNQSALTISADYLEISEINGYYTNPALYIEIIFSIFFVRYLLLEYTDIKAKLVKSISKIVLILLLLILPYSLFIFKNKYSIEHSKNEYGFPIYDADRDGLIDSKDADTNNNGKNNFRDTLRKEVLAVANEIIESDRVIPSKPGSIIYIAYQKLNKPLPPVFLNFGIKNLENYKIMSYNELFYEYLKPSLVQYNSDVDLISGNFLFILDSHGEILNIGLIMEDNSIALTFESSLRRNYSMKDISIYYQKADYSILVEK